MILRPTGKRSMIEMLQALKPEQRKVIVLAGRHLNEGTDLIAEKHHQEWENTAPSS